MKSERSYPIYKVNKKAEASLVGGHPWVYENDILEFPETEPENGTLADVVSPKGAYLGTGFVSLKSKIRVRLISRNANDTFDAAFWRRRAEYAWSYRKTVLEPDDLSACRVIFGEPDGLPGLTVDKFGDCLSFQIVSLGMERMRDDILAILAEVFRPQCIYERDDLAVREKEGMEQRKGCVYGAVPPELIIREHDALMAVDIENGQKTGHFLDQQENRGHLRPYSAGRTVLDLCCHTGGFSIHAALYGAAHVQAVDVSETALAMVRGNAARNGVADRVETVCANVFDLVRQDCEEGRQFGLVICDPPAFAKSRSALDGAYRGYRELNRRCMQLTEPGGFLVTCSCSQFMTQPLFEQMLTEAAKGAGRQVRLLERLMQSRDHPATLGEEHSMYLKGCILQVL